MIQTLRDNCLDANRSQKLDSSAVHLWAVLRAGGDGVRLRDLTGRIAGDSRPKQFCRIVGEQSLFRETRTRLDPLFIRDHQVFVFSRAHERYYGADLTDAGDSCVIEQPLNRGTGTVREKFRMVGEDSWDRGTVALSALFAVQAQAGNDMSQGFFPSPLHQDPRYFRRGTGSGWARLRNSLPQRFITRGDSGHIQPNYSEWLGNSAAGAISNAYYSDHRTAHEAATEICVQVGVDAATNVLKESCPDLQTLFRRKHRREKSSSTEP
jgi:hypothetical protein